MILLRSAKDESKTEKISVNLMRPPMTSPLEIVIKAPEANELDRAPGKVVLKSINSLTTDIGSQVSKQTFKRCFFGNARCEMDSVVAKVETRLHDATLAAMERLGITRLELEDRSTIGCSTRNPSIVALHPDQSDFAGKPKGLHPTASVRFKGKKLETK